MIAEIAVMLLLAGYQYGGTFIAAVICSDGIVIAADSRTTFLDTSGNPFAYLDGIPKIYVDRGAAVAVSGMTSMDGELFSSFVRRNHDLLSRPVNEVMFGFLLWMPLTNGNNVGMISVGFIDGKPMICSKAPIVPQNCINSGFVSNKTSALLRDSLAKLGRLPTTQEAAAALTAAIEDYSRIDRLVGGPVSVLKVSGGAPPQWAGSPPTDPQLTHICDLVAKRGMDIVAVGSREELQRQLNAACRK